MTATDGQTRQKTAQAGFTLVELAVVMIIIGLLIGGILKGQELIANAQVTSTVSQVKGIDSAVTTFRDMYNGVPGDIAGARVPNCTGTCAPAAATLGNGRVDQLFTAAPTVEGLAFWLQLNAADLIAGINPNLATPTVWGGNYPAAKMGGGFHIAFLTGLVAPPAFIGANLPRAGHYLALHNAPNAAVAAGTAGLTPNQAFRIDSKLDDGSATGGSVRGMGTPGTAAGNCANVADGLYNEADPALACGLYIRIQG